MASISSTQMEAVMKTHHRPCWILPFIILLILNGNAQHIGTPAGFANVPAYGVDEITGGSGGEIVIINGQNDAKKLQDALDSDDEPRIIYIQGAVQLPEYPQGTTIPVSDVTARMTCVRSNKTILGVGNDAKIYGSGLSIYSGNGEDNPQESSVNNIIIQNLTFQAAPDDAINIQGGSHHIWVDHCTFTDGPNGPLSDVDGQLDFKRGSDYLTVSYCLFTKHKKMSLIGHSNKVGDIDRGFLRATYDHNFFNDLGGTASSRHPRVRFGIVHVLNCFIQGVGKDRNTEGVVSQCEARVFVEGCHFRFAKWGGSVNEHSSDKESDGLLEVRNNSHDQCSKDFSFVRGAGFNPADYFTYNYTAENSTNLPNTLPGKVGAGIIDIEIQKVATTAKVPVSFVHTPSFTQQNDMLHLSGCDSKIRKLSPIIVDITGRTVYRYGNVDVQNGKVTLRINNLPPGLFFLNIPSFGSPVKIIKK